MASFVPVDTQGAVLLLGEPLGAEGLVSRGIKASRLVLITSDTHEAFGFERKYRDAHAIISDPFDPENGVDELISGPVAAILCGSSIAHLPTATRQRFLNTALSILAPTGVLVHREDVKAPPFSSDMIHPVAVEVVSGFRKETIGKQFGQGVSFGYEAESCVFVFRAPHKSAKVEIQELDTLVSTKRVSKSERSIPRSDEPQRAKVSSLEPIVEELTDATTAEKKAALNVLANRLGLKGIFSKKSAPLRLRPPPAKAPALWPRDAKKGETAPAFATRVYKQWMGRGLTQAHLEALNPELYDALDNWKRDKKRSVPEGFYLPTKSEWNDRLLEEPELYAQLDEHEKHKLHQAAIRRYNRKFSP
jgi:hypothetical protein